MLVVGGREKPAQGDAGNSDAAAAVIVSGVGGSGRVHQLIVSDCGAESRATSECNRVCERGHGVFDNGEGIGSAGDRDSGNVANDSKMGSAVTEGLNWRPVSGTGGVRDIHAVLLPL